MHVGLARFPLRKHPEDPGGQCAPGALTLRARQQRRCCRRLGAAARQDAGILGRGGVVGEEDKLVVRGLDARALRGGAAARARDQPHVRRA
eukprot:3445571-Rhodomonas_salina.1